MTTVDNSSSSRADLVAYFKQMRTGGSSSATATDTRTSAFKTANSAMSDMTSLVAQVRVLDRQARSLSESNTAGIDTLRKNVDSALTKFNNISKTYNPDAKPPAETSASSQPATLDQLRDTITDMRSNLKDNISKVGVAMQKAIASGANATTSNATSTLWTQFAERQSSKYL